MIFFHSSEASASLISGKIPWLATCLEVASEIDFPTGIERISEDIEVKPVEYETASPSPCLFETHRDHIDVQICLEGEERIFLARRSGLSGAGAWDEKGDVTFYSNPETFADGVVMKPGDVLVLFPEDAHRCGEQVCEGESRLRKLVFKVHRNLW